LQAQERSAENDFFWGREQDDGFAREFREFGIDVEALGLGEAAARIRGASIRLGLVKALDAWAPLRRRARGENDPGWKKLVEVARQADDDPWRNEFRGERLRRDRQALEKLADRAPIRELAPATAYLLGHALWELGATDKAMTVLREAHGHHPDDFWLNDALGWFSLSAQPPRYDDALHYYGITIALRPRNALPHKTVADLLVKKGALDEAVAEYSRAIELDPKNAGAWHWRGFTYVKLRQYDKAIADYSKVIELDAKDAVAWNNRGREYYKLHQYDQAVSDLNKAIELDPKYTLPHNNLGLALYNQGKLAEAIGEYRQAIALDPKYADANSNLGIALADQGKLDEAIAEYRKAIALNPKYAAPHNDLGNALNDQGKLDEAIAEYRKAIALDPKLAGAHNNLGTALHDQRKLDEAIAEYREAIALDPKLAAAHNSLGNALHDQGKLDEAIAEYREALRLRPDLARARNNLRKAEQIAELTKRLPAVLEGKDRPKDAAEGVAFARLCQMYRKQYAAAARFYAETFAAEPKLAEGLNSHRYCAACAAALAGCGQGEDAAGLDHKERARLRRQALDWLRADLAAWGRLLDKEPDSAGRSAVVVLQHWQADPDLAGVRGPEALGKLPEGERQSWRQMWADLAETLTRAQAKLAPEKKSEVK
jgi:tetratricopeptide (TPR) repeat protein